MPPPEVALVRPLRQVASFGCLRRNSPLLCWGVTQDVTRRDFGVVMGAYFCQKCLISLVPGERIELPTNGLQNRCSTAELTRQKANIGAFHMAPLPSYAAAATILLPFRSLFV